MDSSGAKCMTAFMSVSSPPKQTRKNKTTQNRQVSGGLAEA
jgi:hypothetical protein